MKTFLFLMIFFIAIFCVLAGLLLITSPGGGFLKLPLGLLNDTPYKDYFVRGILFCFLLAAVNVLTMVKISMQSKDRYNWAIADGIVIIVLIVGQAILIHAFHWVHFIFLTLSMLILLIAYQLKGKWAA